ncbi:MAG: hypothetical protein II656_04445 [Ruminococcus sp.]|nr:hypothetical protein [Ruminococcus sp.]
MSVYNSDDLLANLSEESDDEVEVEYFRYVKRISEYFKEYLEYGEYFIWVGETEKEATVVERGGHTCLFFLAIFILLVSVPVFPFVIDIYFDYLLLYVLVFLASILTLVFVFKRAGSKEKYAITNRRVMVVNNKRFRYMPIEDIAGTKTYTAGRHIGILYFIRKDKEVTDPKNYVSAFRGINGPDLAEKKLKKIIE